MCFSPSRTPIPRAGGDGRLAPPPPPGSALPSEAGTRARRLTTRRSRDVEPPEGGRPAQDRSPTGDGLRGGGASPSRRALAHPHSRRVDAWRHGPARGSVPSAAPRRHRFPVAALALWSSCGRERGGELFETPFFIHFLSSPSRHQVGGPPPANRASPPSTIHPPRTRRTVPTPRTRWVFLLHPHAKRALARHPELPRASPLSTPPRTRRTVPTPRTRWDRRFSPPPTRETRLSPRAP